jgi:hypothetical protein
MENESFKELKRTVRVLSTSEKQISWRIHASDIKGDSWLLRPVRTMVELLHSVDDSEHRPSFPQGPELFDVAISFNGKDSATVDALQESLGTHCTLRRYDQDSYDQDRMGKPVAAPGDDIWKVSRDLLRHARLVIPIISENYWGGAWCPRELWYLADDPECADIKVLPLFVDTAALGAAPDPDRLKEVVASALEQAAQHIATPEGPKGDDVKTRLAEREILSKEIFIVDGQVVSSDSPKTDEAAAIILAKLAKPE